MPNGAFGIEGPRLNAAGRSAKRCEGHRSRDQNFRFDSSCSIGRRRFSTGSRLARSFSLLLTSWAAISGNSWELPIFNPCKKTMTAAVGSSRELPSRSFPRCYESFTVTRESPDQRPDTALQQSSNDSHRPLSDMTSLRFNLTWRAKIYTQFSRFRQGKSVGILMLNKSSDNR